MKLPKNFRQIGEVSLDTKIYIEDYVMTYLGEITRDSKTYVRGAILFGKMEMRNKQTVIFVSGAMAAQNIELDLDETVFDDIVWKKIYETKEEYFKDTQVVGWYLCRTGMSIRLNDKIKKTHFENFPGNGKILYMRDPLEEEEAMYVYRGQDLVKQAGYYIYYVKNVQMQDYLIEVKREQEAALSYEKMVAMHRDERIIRQSRTKMKRKKQRQRSLLSKTVAAASFMFLFGALGTYFLFGRTEIPNMAMIGWTQAIASIQANLQSKDQEEETLTKVFSADETDSMKKTDSKKNSTKKESSLKDGNSKETMDRQNGEKKISTQQVKKTNSSILKRGSDIYTVRQGDTITGISRRMYGSNQYVNVIMQENALGSEDAIYPGQKLRIPKIED